jgi:hypothetical protein
MPFNPKTASNAGKKSKRGLAKKEASTIKQKMELLHEEILDDLILNQKSLTKTERVKLFVTLSGYIFPKTNPVKENNKPETPFNLSDLVGFESESESTK